MIIKNPDEIIMKSLRSLSGLAKEIVIVDNYSKKVSLDIIRDFDVKIFFHKENNLGLQKGYGLKKCRGEWILSLDCDEIVTEELATEIKETIQKTNNDINGYIISFQNYFLGRPINYGGENYRMLRLFRRKSGKIKESLVHEHFEIREGKVKNLKNKIKHYSYRSIKQMMTKFTDYAKREFVQKSKVGETSSLKKLILYPLHMFYARFIKDKGYKDGMFRIPLDLGFAYMEFLTYLLLMFNAPRKAQGDKSK